MIRFNFEDIKKIKLPQKVIKAWLRGLALKEGFSIGELSYIFCSDEYLLSINQNYLQHNTYTDIITFDYSGLSPTLPIKNREKLSKRESVNKKIISGDVFISIVRVKENALKYKTTFEKELARVMSHGLFHLMGYKDKSSKGKKKMRSKENQALRMADSIV